MDIYKKTISFIIPTVGRSTLSRTVRSIEKAEDDKILVIRDDPPHNDWGSFARNTGMEQAICDYLAFIDDDDWYVQGHRDIMERAMQENTKNYPIFFRMQFPSGRILWKDKKFKNGNVGTPMILVPNDREKLRSRWNGTTYAEFHFINEWGWSYKDIIWRDEVIVNLGHNDEKYESGLTFQERRKLKIYK